MSKPAGLEPSQPAVVPFYAAEYAAWAALAATTIAAVVLIVRRAFWR